MPRRNSQLQAARHAYLSLEADRKRFERNGLGPGDAYLGLWRLFHDDFDLVQALRKKLADSALKGRERKDFLARYDAVMSRSIDTLSRIVPYERSRLKAKEAPPDQHEHGRVPPDLTKLTRAELDALEKMVLKVSGGRTDTTTPARRP
jgi:hypothetical protein